MEVLQEPSCRDELREMGAAAQQLGWGGGWPGDAADPALDSESSRVLGGQRDSANIQSQRPATLNLSQHAGAKETT